ncbi:MAG: helix-turn-helix transcriptional regulator, partial [Solirubrobacterales bacterium]
MAKDTEKLIRQLSLISFLMANRRPVSALEIKQEVEGYSSMNEDAFARRFYADRAELESLGIHLQVQKPGEGFFEAELYALPPENYYLPTIKFADAALAAMRTSLVPLAGHFAYAEPLRLALQQVSWGRPSPLTGPDTAPMDVSVEASAGTGGRELSQRLSKIETAISRRKTIVFSYYTMQRDEVSDRKVNPYHLVFRGGQFYLIGYSHERDAVRVFRLSRIQGKVSYATKAEHDFAPPEDFDRRDYATRADWQMGEIKGRAQIFVRERIAWLIERDFGNYGELRPAKKADGAPGKGAIFETDYANAQQLIAWALAWRHNARILDPPELSIDATERLQILRERHEGEFVPAETVARPLENGAVSPPRSNGRSESVIRPERFARLVTLAGIFIDAARNDKRLRIADVIDQLKISEEELREDVAVLNVVNFGGGTYVLYADVGDEEIEVDADTYGDSFAQPARLLPLEAKALIAAIDLLGDHLPQTSLRTAREKITTALGHDPSQEGLEIAPGSDDSAVVRKVNDAIAANCVLELDYYKENEDQFSKRLVEPYRLANGNEGWYVACWDLGREDARHFRLDRIREATVTDEEFEPRDYLSEVFGGESWLERGEVEDARVARVWVSPERARWVREDRTVVAELAAHTMIAELPSPGVSWLLRGVLRDAG